MKMESFVTHRLLLQPADARFAAAVADYLKRNRELLKPFEPTRTEEYFAAETQKQRLLAAADDFRSGVSLLWLIFGKEDLETVIGSVQLSQISKGPFCSCYLGYQLDEKFRGQGRMPEAVQPVIRYAFDHAGLHRIEASVMPRNKASQRVLEKLGFEPEGRSRAYLRINGKWEDHLRYALINENFDR